MLTYLSIRNWFTIYCNRCCWNMLSTFNFYSIYYDFRSRNTFCIATGLSSCILFIFSVILVSGILFVLPLIWAFVVSSEFSLVWRLYIFFVISLFSKLDTNIILSLFLLLTFKSKWIIEEIISWLIVAFIILSLVWALVIYSIFSLFLIVGVSVDCSKYWVLDISSVFSPT